MYKRLLLYFAAVAVNTFGLPAFSADLASQSVNNDSKVSTTSSGTREHPLMGGVQKVELGLEKLRDVGLDLKAALRATSSLYEEVTIQPVRLITQPTMIGSGTIVNIPIGTQPLGPAQPARKERVDLAINEMKPIVDMLKRNADEFMSGEKQLDLSETVAAKLEPQFNNWVGKVNNIAVLQNRLEQITKAPPYDNLAIAQLALTIEKDIKDLEKIRLSIYRVIRREGKRKSSSRE